MSKNQISVSDSDRYMAKIDSPEYFETAQIFRNIPVRMTRGSGGSFKRTAHRRS